MSEIKALRQAVIIDTCADGSAGKALANLAQHSIGPTTELRSAIILLGSAADALSYEASPYGRGILTEALLTGMLGAALDGDRIDVQRLFSWTRGHVAILAKGIGGVQEPLILAANAASFSLGRISGSNKTVIELARLRPHVLRILVQNEDNVDDTALSSQVRDRLRSLANAISPDGQRREPSMTYLDSVLDELPGALLPRVRYKKTEKGVSFQLTISKDGKKVANYEEELSGVEGMVDGIVRVLINAVRQVRP